MFGRKKVDERGGTGNAKKRTTRKYGQIKRKHSSMGKNSCWLAAGALVLLGAAIGVAFVMRGNTAGFVGGLGILSIVIAGLGFRAAMKGFRERERNYITCKIGITANILILIGLIVIFLGGLFK